MADEPVPPPETVVLGNSPPLKEAPTELRQSMPFYTDKEFAELIKQTMRKLELRGWQTMPNAPREAWTGNWLEAIIVGFSGIYQIYYLAADPDAPAAGAPRRLRENTFRPGWYTWEDAHVAVEPLMWRHPE